MLPLFCSPDGTRTRDPPGRAGTGILTLAQKVHPLQEQPFDIFSVLPLQHPFPFQRFRFGPEPLKVNKAPRALSLGIGGMSGVVLGQTLFGILAITFIVHVMGFGIDDVRKMFHKLKLPQ